VAGSIARDVRSRFRGSLLGGAWIVLQPLAMILIYTLVFARVMHSRLPGAAAADDEFSYSVFLCAGLLPWGFFAETIQRCISVFPDNANLIKKNAFPRLSLPAIAFGIAAFNFAVVFGLFLGFLILVRLLPGWVVLAALPVLVLQSLLAIGIGVMASVANVFFRDVGHLVALALQFGFWFTPIVYPATVLPEWARNIMSLVNPMVGVVDWYQRIFLTGEIPAFAVLAPAAVWTVVFLAGAWRLHARRADEIVDML